MRTIALLAALLAAVPAAANTTVRVEKDIVYATPGGVPVTLDAYLPAGGGTARPAVILIHGGGFTSGDKRAMAPYAARLAAVGFAAFSVNYRLAPRYLFPAAHDDVKSAVRFVRANAKRFRLDPKRIGALGSSAGGNVAGILATAGSGSRTRGSRVAAAVSWSGSMDMSLAPRLYNLPNVPSPFLGCSFAACPEKFAQASPITHVDRTDAPLFLAHSADERVPLQHATTMAERLRAAKVPVVLHVLPGRRHATGFAVDVWDETVAFLRQHLRQR